MPSYTLTLNCSDGVDVVGGPVTVTGNNKETITFTTDGTTNLQSITSIPSILFTNLKTLAISFRDANGNYLAGTLKTNSNGAPTDTFTLVAGGVPLTWAINSGITKPLTGSITTGLFLTPTAATVGTLTVMALFS